MLENKSLKSYIEELIQEVEKELDEANVTGNVDGYQTPHAFSRKSDNERRKKTATQFGYELVDNDVNNIDESINEVGAGDWHFKAIQKLYQKAGTFGRKKIAVLITKNPNSSWDKIEKELKGSDYDDVTYYTDMLKLESVVNKMKSVNKKQINENRWLELKNDDSMHANKKLAVGLKELKYQLAEVEKFFSWYNKIKNINELDSDNYWKRTNTHIYKIKERLINIARTLQEIEK